MENYTKEDVANIIIGVVAIYICYKILARPQIVHKHYYVRTR